MRRKNHPGECLAGREGCFGFDQSCHRLKDFPSAKQGKGGRFILQRILHVLQVVINTKISCILFRVVKTRKTSLYGHQYVASLSFIYLCIVRSPGPTLPFETPYIEVKFVVFLENLSETLLVSTPIGDSMIATWIYKNCPTTISQKFT